jgi:DNA-binding transcriptional regulator WhiA
LCKTVFKYNPKNPYQIFCSQRCNTKSRAYKIDENFFEKINTESKAYLLGLIFADGSISKKNYMNISSKDENLIKMCKKILRTDRPIYNYQQSFALTIRNQKLANSLRKWGAP